MALPDALDAVRRGRRLLGDGLVDGVPLGVDGGILAGKFRFARYDRITAHDVGVPALEGVALHGGGGQTVQLAVAAGAFHHRDAGAAAGFEVDDDLAAVLTFVQRLCGQRRRGQPAQRHSAEQDREHLFESFHCTSSFRGVLRRRNPVP